MQETSFEGLRIKGAPAAATESAKGVWRAQNRMSRMDLFISGKRLIFWPIFEGGNGCLCERNGMRQWWCLLYFASHLTLYLTKASVDIGLPNSRSMKTEGRKTPLWPDGAPALIAIVKTVKRQEPLKVLILYTMFPLF